jgi:hypothetical protein
MQPPSNCRHHWVASVVSLGEICAKCQWRRLKVAGIFQYAPPDPKASNPQITS